ncbi:hypothetical protein [Halorarum salinum]|uniref:Uncharacterized protein n=1 Tax=Halorarum salinum TaxID=2743089 RepID=A0A7D5LD19_9EURY|nr:hypothetical protein [Halobaculum salinum]QLG63668.1 hypothetical protein HUG12_18810 [Halobaculum salinum]
MDSNGLPDDVDEAVPLYHRIWDRFGDEPFAARELAQWLDAHEADGRDRGTRDLPDRLASLVAYGLLRRDGPDRFRVRCRPGESAAEWHARLEPRTEALHRRVHGADLYDGSADDGGDPEGEIRYRGSAYRGVLVDGSTDVGELHDALTEVLERSPEYDGVVLRAPATEAGTVQWLADGLYDVGATDVDGRRFEKVNSLVVGDDKDALEYRMFLAPERA